jgi:hypothetical protein
MNSPLFAAGSALGNAFNDIFKTEADDTVAAKATQPAG